MKGALITGVRPRTPAAKAGLRAGETLLSINGHPIADVLDYRFYSYGARLILQTDARRVLVRHEEGGDLGLSFSSLLMDGEKRCANRCVFCFIDQQPPGLRESLYVKDDDARLSFLRGQYITLSNLDENDVERMIRMRISPLRVSVHTTDPELRVKMLGNPRAGRRSLDLLKKLAGSGIEIHAQIVVCPGLNDGAALARTLHDLRMLSVKSVAVVPVGLTRYREGLFPLQAVGCAEARDILAVAERFADQQVFCADELFIKAGCPIPPDEYYEDYPQLENGVGLIRLFDEEWNAQKTSAAGIKAFSVATGVDAAPFLRAWLRDYPAAVYAVENRFWGEHITVAGLLTGGDLLAALRDKPLGEMLLIPTTMLRQGGDVFLDGMTPDALQNELGVKVVAVEPNGDALRQIIEKR